MSTCQAAQPLLGPFVAGNAPITWSECGAPAAGQVTGRCDCGHERTIDVCLPHELTLLSTPIGCVACFEDGHECRMTVRPAGFA